MGDTSSQFHQVVTSLQHDKINLQKRFADVQQENQMLRQQLYHVSSLLDIAVCKLGRMGVALEAPLDIRALRSEALKRSTRDAGDGSYDVGAMTAPNTGEQMLSSSSSQGRRFQLRTHLREHTKAVQCCAFSPGDDTLIVTGGMDNRLVLQNFFSGEKQWEMTGHDENVSDVAWLEGSRSILSASYDGTVKVWDPKRTEPYPVYQHTAAGFVLCATPLDKAFVFACADSRRRTYIVDTRAHKPVFREHQSRVNSLAFDSSTVQLLMGHVNGIVSVWDIRRTGLPLSTTSATATASTANIATTASAFVSPMLESGGGPLSSAPGSVLFAVSATAAPPLVTSAPPEHEPPQQVQPQQQSGAAAFGSCIAQFQNEASHSTISFLAHYHSCDDTKRLVCVSGDNMVRVYRSSLSATSAEHTGDPYHLRNVLPGVPTMGFGVRAGFWKGNSKDKSHVSAYFDEGEKDAEQPAARRLSECDLIATGGPDNVALVFDVSEEGGSGVLERLEGHSDRVTGAAIHHSTNRPIIATTSADSTVRIWVPSKT